MVADNNHAAAHNNHAAARTIAVVGVGPRGLNILVRLVEQQRQQVDASFTRILLIDPSEAGSGAHDVDQPEHLIANTVASQITMFEDATVVAQGQPIFEGPTFYEWAKQVGYLYHNENSPDGTDGGTPREVQPNDYLPRALLGKYMQYTYSQVIARAPKNIEIEHIRQRVVDMKQAEGEQMVRLQLSDQSWIEAEYAFLTTGHGKNKLSNTDATMNAFVEKHRSRNPHLAWVPNPYPVHNLKDIGFAASVAIQGTGLTATDVVSELTIGRGGRFTYDRDTERPEAVYHKSGSEPTIYLYSRKGAPFGGRGVNQKGCTGKYIASWCTDAAVDKLKKSRVAKTGSEQIDFEVDLLPLLKKDMAYAYHCATAKSESVQPNDPAHFEPSAEEMGAVDEMLNPRAFADGGAGFTDTADYRHTFIKMLDDDIRAAWEGNIDGAEKAASDVIRDIRSTLRYAIDHAGLTPESHAVFLKHYSSVFNRCAVGPPMERNVQLRALIAAGVVKMDIGPSPSISTDESTGTFVIKSQFREAQESVHIDVIVLAKLDKFILEQDSSALMRNMREQGMLRPFYHNLGGIDVDSEQHPITVKGRSLDRVWALGNLVEGANFYTYVLPRPGVESRSLCDAVAMVGHMHKHAQAEGRTQRVATRG